MEINLNFGLHLSQKLRNVVMVNLKKNIILQKQISISSEWHSMDVLVESPIFKKTTFIFPIEWRGAEGIDW